MTRACLATLAALLVLGSAPAAAARPVPYPFLGVGGEGVALESSIDLEREFRLMLRSGVQSVRSQFHWEMSQPYGRWEEVPEGERGNFRDEAGIPTDWRFVDRQVAAAARRRIKVLAVVQYAPPWAARHPGRANSPPRSAHEYARFAGAAARRYGPRGSFWTEHPELPRTPVRDWQLWNEPALQKYWSDQPWAHDYVELVRATRRELRRAHRRARVVLAGFPNNSWESLREVYRAGGRRSFDIAAVHPFTAKVHGVVEILERNRRVMRRNGDRRKPLVVTETSWTSSLEDKPHGEGWETTERGQARKLRQVIRRLARERRRLRIKRVFWYTWMTPDNQPGDSFRYSGLRRLNEDGTLTSKPALRAYRRVALRLQGCRRKAHAADRCSR